MASRRPTVTPVNYRNTNAIYAHARLWIDTYPGDPGYRERVTLELDGWYRGAMEYVTGMPEPQTPTDRRAYVQGKARPARSPRGCSRWRDSPARECAILRRSSERPHERKSPAAPYHPGAAGLLCRYRDERRAERGWGARAGRTADLRAFRS